MRDCRKEALPDCTFLELPKRPLSAPVDYYAPQDIERPLDHKGLISRKNSTNILKKWLRIKIWAAQIRAC